MTRKDSRPDPLAAVDAIPRELLPAALARLAARLLEPAPLPEPQVREYLSPDEVAARLGRNRRWVYANAEAMGAIKRGRRTLLIPVEGLNAFLDGG